MGLGDLWFYEDLIILFSFAAVIVSVKLGRKYDSSLLLGTC